MYRTPFYSVLLWAVLFIAIVPAWAGIDMQAHVASDEGKAAYTTYLTKQSSYYQGAYSYSTLLVQEGDVLFGTLNRLMGNTCKNGSSQYSYDKLRQNYVKVDRDLNRSGYIIGYYNGQSINGTWDSGKTWNREHTWPQSKGANKSTPMGHDMQSVRPASTSVNSDRGNDAYGESGSYYDPNDVRINNSYYNKANLGSYRGDAARVILYDYLVYGEAGGHKNNLYNGNAQLLSKLGSRGVFESIRILLKWHMQDPPSLTEMVRNDGAADYQGNRNPFIDYPELAIQLLKDDAETTIYDVTIDCTEQMTPAYRYTTSDGFIAYLHAADGTHPNSVNITGADYTYEAETGRLTIQKVSGNLRISSDTPNSLEAVDMDAPIMLYSLSGQPVTETTTDELRAVLSTLPMGIYILQQGNHTRKIVR